jgi:carbon starvation protein CstA
MAVGLAAAGVALVVNARLALIAVKVLHTLIWAFFAGCILAVPVAALRGRFRLGAVLSGVVLVECLVLALNGGRCPLTDLASRFTTERADNFDIYLPLWLAHWNKTIFGTLFVAGEALLAACWVIRQSRTRQPGGSR